MAAGEHVGFISRGSRSDWSFQLDQKLLILLSMKPLFRSLALWAALYGTIWMMTHSSPILRDVVSLGILSSVVQMISFAGLVLLTWLAASVLPKGRFWRWSFWTITMAGWIVVGVLVSGRLEGMHRDGRQIVYLMLGAAVLAGVWIAARTRRFPSLRVLGDMAFGVAILGIAGGVTYGVYESKTRSMRQEALARWSEIGMPLPEFEKTLKPVQESEGSNVAREIFRDLLGAPFYKRSSGDQSESDPLAKKSAEGEKLIQEAIAVYQERLAPADEIEASKLPAAPSLDARAGEIDAAFRRILAAEPARWACDPMDFLTMQAPNFLGIRKFAQLGYAESLRRTAAGDVEGATRAIAAVKHLKSSKEEGPSLVTLMIHVAVEALLARSEVWLEVPGSDLASLQREVEKCRTALLRTMRWEALYALRVSEGSSGQGEALDDMKAQMPLAQYLPRWDFRVISKSWFRRIGAIGALNGADRAAIRMAPETMISADFGKAMEEVISERRPTFFDLQVTRAAMRIHATLLVREQAILIRDARARLNAGQPVESRNSVIMPQLKWELTADPVNRTVTTRLANAPEWILNKDVTAGDNFWVLPIDGTVAWKFGAKVKGTAAR